MARHEFYRQCKLERPFVQGRREEGTFVEHRKDGSFEVLVSWISDKIAQIGNVVRLKDEEGNWSEGWRVVEAWERRKGERVEAAVRDYKH